MTERPFRWVEPYPDTPAGADGDWPTLQALNWPGVELRHLAALSAIAAQHSFARAARSLGYSQSAVSQQVAALERGVGHRVLERSHGRAPVALTPAGQIALHHAQAIARELARARAHLDALDSESGTLAVGIHAMTGLHLLSRIVEQMGADIAALEIYEFANDRRLLDLVEHEEIDLAIVHPPSRSGMHFTELIQEEYVAVTAGRLAERLGPEPVGLESLALFPLLLPKVPQMALDLGAYFESSGAYLIPTFVAEDPATLCELASRGHGIAVLPRLVAHDAPDGRMVALRDPPKRRLGLVWRKDSHRAERLRSCFAAAARSVIMAATEHVSMATQASEESVA